MLFNGIQILLCNFNHSKSSASVFFHFYLERHTVLVMSPILSFQPHRWCPRGPTTTHQFYEPIMLVPPNTLELYDGRVTLKSTSPIQLLSKMQILSCARVFPRLWSLKKSALLWFSTLSQPLFYRNTAEIKSTLTYRLSTVRRTKQIQNQLNKNWTRDELMHK